MVSQPRRWLPSQIHQILILHSSTEESTATLIFMTDTVIIFKLPVLMYQKMKTMTKNNS